MLEPLQAFFLP